MSKSVIEALEAAARRDKEKGGSGLRSTTEVAEYTGLSIATARRHLWAAERRGDVEAYDGGASGEQGNPIFWKLRQS